MKYLYGSFKLAKEHRSLPEYMLWLRLKSLNTEGRIYKNRLHASVRSVATYSTARISQLLRRMADKGYLTPLVSNNELFAYEIASYKTVWRMLGSTIRRQDGEYQAHRYEEISWSDKLLDNSYWKSLLQTIDIARNVAAQSYSIDCLEKKRRRSKQSAQQVDKPSPPSLSCKGTAKLLGYKTASAGFNVRKNATKYSLIELKHKEKRYELIERGVTFVRYLIDFGREKYAWIKGCVYKIACSAFFCLLPPFTKRTYSHVQSTSRT